MTRADLGLYAEHHFAAQAFKRGYRVSFAPGGIPGYDVILDNGFSLVRVQVKAARRRRWDRASSSYAFLLGVRPGNRTKSRRFDAGSCDVFAFWLDDDSRWSFKTSSGLAGTKATSITIGGRRRKAGAKRGTHGLDNWELFEPVAHT